MHAHESNLNQVRQNRLASNNLVQAMDQPNFQHVWGYSAPLSSQQNHLMAQYSNEPEGLRVTVTDLCDYDWNSVGHSQVAACVPGQAEPLFNPEPHSSMDRHWYTGHNLPLNVDDAGCQFAANDQNFQQQNLLLWPQPKSTTEPNSSLIPYGDYDSFSGFEQTLATGPAPATQRLGELYSNPRQKSGRCVRCWALKKAVLLLVH